jgi:hypothetical protein
MTVILPDATLLPSIILAIRKHGYYAWALGHKA